MLPSPSLARQIPKHSAVHERTLGRPNLLSLFRCGSSALLAVPDEHGRNPVGRCISALADVALLAGGVVATMGELGWFEEMAARRGLALDAAKHPTTRAYCDFLLAVIYSGYPAQITAIWALERSYLESWDSARPGAHSYREFVNRWTTDGFRSYVGDLQSSVDRQLKASIGEQAREAEDAFFWVTHYERGFWDMAMSG